MIGTLIGGNKRHALDNPNIDINSPEAFDLMTGGKSKTASGIRFRPTDGFRYAPVWRAVSMISGDIAKMPLDIFRRLDDGGRDPDRKHPAFRVVRRQANEEQSAVRFWRQMLVSACYWNHAEAYIHRNGRGDALGLYPLLPDRTAPERIGGRLYYSTETSRRDGTPWLRSIPAEDVLTIKGPFWDDMTPCELVDLARESWALGLAEQRFSAKFFGSGGRTGGVLELPLGMTKGSADKVEEGFRKTYESADSWFRTVILRDNAKFHEANKSPKEGQMIEAREEQARDVARFFNMQPSRLGVTGSTSYNSRTEDNQEYLDTTLSPWLTDIAQECYLKLLSKAQRDADSHYFEHNANSLLRMDPLKRYQTYAIGVRNRILLPNEARAAENLNPIEGGDEFPTLVPKSPGGADKGENDKGRGPADDSSGEPDGTETDKAERQHKLRRVVYGMCRQARDKAKRHRAFGEWIGGGLVSHRDEAKRLLGDDAIVEELMLRFQEAEEVPVTELEPTVDRIASELERGC